MLSEWFRDVHGKGKGSRADIIGQGMASAHLLDVRGGVEVVSIDEREAQSFGYGQTGARFPAEKAWGELVSVGRWALLSDYVPAARGTHDDDQSGRCHDQILFR